MKTAFAQSALLRCIRATKPQLPSIPYVLPTPEILEGTGAPNPNRFVAECSGVMQPPEPALRSRLRGMAEMTIPNKDALWKMPNHEAFELLGRTCSYHTLAQYAAEHSFFHLFDYMVFASDAPLPHIAYTDFMRICTFASLQRPMDEQFILPAPLLRTLLTVAAHTLLKDPGYFYTAERMFRVIEQQQVAGSEVLSAWVMCCTFAGRPAGAMEVLKVMDRAGIAFDQTVFCSMMCPSAQPGCKVAEERYSKARVLHARLHSQLEGSSPKEALASGTALHAMFVSYSLLLKHAAKWESLRVAHEAGVVPFGRTLHFAAEVYRIERGLRCGPKTAEAIATMFAHSGMVDEVLYVLYFTRWAESLPQFAGIPVAHFSEESTSTIVDAMTVVARRDVRAAATCHAVVEALQAPSVKDVEARLAGLVRRSTALADPALSESLSKLRGVIASIRRDKRLDNETSTTPPALAAPRVEDPQLSKVAVALMQEETQDRVHRSRLPDAWMNI